MLFTGRDAHDSPRHQREKRFLVLTAERGCVGLTEEDFSLTNAPNMKLLKAESQRDPHGHIPAPPHTPNATPQIKKTRPDWGADRPADPAVQALRVLRRIPSGRR